MHQSCLAIADRKCYSVLLPRLFMHLLRVNGCILPYVTFASEAGKDGPPTALQLGTCAAACEYRTASLHYSSAGHSLCTPCRL